MRPSCRRKWLLAGLLALGLLGLGEVTDRLAPAGASGPRLTIWHGTEQKVGHLGDNQDDFNLMGHVERPHELLSLQYTLNDGVPVELNFRGYRRLAADGHFNADVPIAALAPGANTIELEGRFVDGSITRQKVSLTRLAGRSSLPWQID